MYTSQIQNYIQKIWNKYLAKILVKLHSDLQMFKNPHLATKIYLHCNALVHEKFKHLYSIFRTLTDECSQHPFQNNTFGFLCGLMMENSKAASSLYMVDDILTEHLLYVQEWTFQLWPQFGLNLTLNKVNLTFGNCLDEYIVFLTKHEMLKRDQQLRRICGKRPQEEVFIAFTKINIILQILQFMHIYGHKVILLYQIYTRSFINTVNVTDFSFHPSNQFLHKTFIIFELFNLLFYHIQVHKYHHLIIKALKVGKNVHVIQGPVIDRYHHVIQTGSQRILQLNTFQCLLLTTESLQDNLTHRVTFLSGDHQFLISVELNKTRVFHIMSDVDTMYQIGTLANAYVNITVKDFIYHGPTSEGCLHGGFTIYHKDGKSALFFTECLSLCNFDSSVGYPTSRPVSYVTSSSEACTVLYSYNGISNATLTFSLSTSSCQGIFINLCNDTHDSVEYLFSKYTSISYRWFQLPMPIVKSLRIPVTKIQNCTIFQFKAHSKNLRKTCGLRFTLFKMIDFDETQFDIRTYFAEDSLMICRTSSCNRTELNPCIFSRTAGVSENSEGKSLLLDRSESVVMSTEHGD